MRLDDLLQELHDRTGQILAVGDRLRILLETVVTISSDLMLPVVLRAVIEGACRLTDARYGALGVIGPEGKLVEFVTVGVTAEERERIGPEPEGRGILGLLIEEPEPLRLRDLATHGSSYGFPPNHPAMRSFLGVPVRVRNQVFGNLYLCEKRDADQFDEEDEELVTALASAAGVVIENARLYDERRRREEWLDSLAEISTALLSGTPSASVLELVAQHAAQLGGAESARIMVANATGDAVEVVAAHGPFAREIIGAEIPIDETLSGEVLRSGSTVLVTDAERDPRVFRLDDSTLGVGPVLFVPLVGHGAALGVIAIENPKGGRTFGSADVRAVESFAGQAAVAVELSRARAELERLRVFEDRERIARDLHDSVIQRLFATGMSLQGVATRTADADVAARLQRAVDEIDETIRDIRTTVFALGAREQDDTGIRSEVIRLVEEAAEGGGWEPRVRFEGPLDTVASGDVATDLLACLREALSNAVRHAGAHRVDVSVGATRDGVHLVVKDDGVGIPESVARRSGLRNLAQRAEALGGTFVLNSEPSRGTTLEWSVPAPV